MNFSQECQIINSKVVYKLPTYGYKDNYWFSLNYKKRVLDQNVVQVLYMAKKRLTSIFASLLIRQPAESAPTRNRT